MPTVHTNVLATQARHLVEEGASETEAIKKVIEGAGISEEYATEHNLHEEISKLMNRDTEAEAKEAEAQLRQQSEEGYRTDILREEEGETLPSEAELQEGE